MIVTRAQVVAFRLRAGCLAERVRDFAIAARGGLQDTAPRGALLSLHARAVAVGPDSWEAPELVQVWGPRLAVYVVPREEVGTFTLGRLPRDAQAQRYLNEIATAVHGALGGRARSTGEVFRAVGDPAGHGVRACAITGRIHLRWDARTNVVIPARPPEVDPEDARRRLLELFLAWFAPTTLRAFESWSGTSPQDARQTWRALRGLCRVRLDGGERWVLEEDEEQLRRAEPPRGVRLLPHRDPYLSRDHAIAVPNATKRPLLFEAKGELAGAILVDGEVVGTWARQQQHVTLRPWRALRRDERDAVVAEALGLSLPIARPIDVTIAP